MIYRKFFGVIVFICFFQAFFASNVTITTSSATVCSGVPVKFKAAVTTGLVTKWKWLVNPNAGLVLLPNDSAQLIISTFAIAGTYTVSVYATFSPFALDSSKLIINVVQTAQALFSTGAMSLGVPQNVQFTNSSSFAPGGYSWNFGDNTTSLLKNPAHVFNAATTYTVSLIAYGANGCNDTLRDLLTITDTSGLTMPNVFTPNGDGINDVFTPNAHGLKTLACTIYDRWGAKIIDMDMNLQYWDGYTTSGLACTAGTYFYVIKATDLNNKAYSLKGFIQLIR